ncbi:hypothetical protein XAC3810_780096 [Xanthomonas citri pv. citri]|nr:hypothetical protein XAC3810_780096 [Xanthomonas citri pv. citri]
MMPEHGCAAPCRPRASCRFCHLVFAFFLLRNARHSALHAHVRHVVRCVRHRCVLVANRHLPAEIKSSKVTKFPAESTADHGQLALAHRLWSVE